MDKNVKLLLLLSLLLLVCIVFVLFFANFLKKKLQIYGQQVTKHVIRSYLFSMYCRIFGSWLEALCGAIWIGRSSGRNSSKVQQMISWQCLLDYARIAWEKAL